MTAVLGLDDRPQARAQFRVAPAAARPPATRRPSSAAIYGSRTAPTAPARRSRSSSSAAGSTSPTCDTYFGGLGLSGADGDGGRRGRRRRTQPGQDPQGADGEVLLDIEVVGALAPARRSIVVYFAPNTDAGFLDAVSEAAHATPTPAAISISWGQSEDQWTAQARNAMDAAFADAARSASRSPRRRATTAAATGQPTAPTTRDFPSSSPHVLACGGTRLQADPATGTVTAETVWNNGRRAAPPAAASATSSPGRPGRPTSGSPAPAPGRGVPDVAGDADPQTGYQVRVDGQRRCHRRHQRGRAAVGRADRPAGPGHRVPLPLLQPTLYGHATSGRPTPGFRDITSGNNGSFRPGPAGTPAPAWGVPDGESLLTLLRGGPG